MKAGAFRRWSRFGVSLDLSWHIINTLVRKSLTW
jgi:hypothetical protein